MCVGRRPQPSVPGPFRSPEPAATLVVRTPPATDFAHLPTHAHILASMPTRDQWSFNTELLGRLLSAPCSRGTARRAPISERLPAIKGLQGDIVVLVLRSGALR